MRRGLFILTFLPAIVWGYVARAVDVPGNEATNRKLLELWKSDPVRMNRLRQSLAAFNALPADQQGRLKKLDRELHALSSDDQARYRAVMERYAAWLARLPTEQRRSISEAATTSERLKLVDEALDRQWVESLPKSSKDRLARLSGEERVKELEKLREREDERRKLRASARRTVEETIALGPLGFQQQEFRERVQAYVDESLRPLLGPEEQLLNIAYRGSGQRYLSAVFNLSEGRSPLPFPGPAPPGKKKAVRYWRDLPADVVKKLQDPAVPAARDNEGKWPQFALAVAAAAQERGIALPANALGPTKVDEMPPSVKKFITDDLIPKLSDQEKQQLADTVGRWPEYPRKVRELAERRQLQVPGLALPGSRVMWQGLLRSLNRGKAAEKAS